jgi:hypothetical protein
MTTQPESRLSRQIMDALRSRGAFVWKNHGGPTMMAGLPDIAGSYLGRFIAIETKMPGGGQPTPVQRLRAEQIRAAGGAVLSPCRSVAEAVAWLATLTPPTTHPENVSVTVSSGCACPPGWHGGATPGPCAPLSARELLRRPR